LLVAVLAVPAALQAQETTATIRGRVVDASGAPVANAKVEVLDQRTGIIRNFTSNQTGTFLATRLPPGGPYTVIVNDTRTVIVESVGVADVYNMTIDIDAVQLSEEIVVVGETIDIVDVAPGPAATFSSFEMETAVNFNRDIVDVYGIDPRVNIDLESEGAQVNCAGKHPRFNSVTLDGITQNDRFGLNSNGYSTATGMPFPYDSISQVAVELAPMDVTYGGFTACNINAVTKSGTNEWHGSAFYEHSSDGLRGTFPGTSQDPFTARKWGGSVGGPIVKDKLFIFAAYEKAKSPEFLAQGIAGAGTADDRPWLSQADFGRIDSIARNLYSYDGGGQPQDGAQEEDKVMVRVDWNAHRNHNVAFIYNYYDGAEDRASDSDSNEFEFANHFYVKGAKTKTYTVKVASHWTDVFSTELFASRNSMDDSQVTVGPQDFAEVQVFLGSNIVFLGGDDSRQANALNTDSDFFRLSGQLLAGKHVFTGGYDFEKNTIFNQFVQHARGGEIRFQDSSGSNPAFCAGLTAAGRLADPACGLSGIDRFELGLPSRYYYGSGGGSNNPEDAAALFTNTLHSIYLQDELFIDEHDLTLVGGLRYEFFTSGDRPNFNPTFTEANGGLRNDANIDGLSLLMPRVGMNWGVTDRLTVRAGVGRYSGGNPNVWISNAWSNDGLTNVQLLNFYNDTASLLDGGIPLIGSGRPGYDVPQSMFDAVGATTADSANDSNLVLIDPDYKQPNEWKFTGGLSYVFEGGLQLDLDYMHTELRDSGYYVDTSQEIVGTTRAGGPIYDYVAGRGEDNFMLTNSEFGAGSDIFSVQLRKYFTSGLDVLAGYAFTSSKDVAAMTSAVAGSNFTNTALTDLNNPTPGTSNYEVPHRITLRASYGREFFGNAETRFTIYAYAQQGQPQSVGMSSADFEGDGFFGRHLLYVPTGEDDPNVVFDPGFPTSDFFAFVNENGLEPGFVPRNSLHTDWRKLVNLSIHQDLPVVGGSHARLFVRVYNLGAFINEDWGRVIDAPFFTPVFVESSVNSDGQYVFEDFTNRAINTVYESRSVWDAHIGIEFRF
jgi:outer membrane receptor for ferrienterochelin and colicin